MVTETTLEVIDVKIYKGNVKEASEYIPNFMRVLAATRFAKTAVNKYIIIQVEWVEIFKTYNSGTYSSQWMVVDYKIFNKMKGTKNANSNLLYVVEQTPDKFIIQDITDYLIEVKIIFI